jgi:hypothetical protein
MAHAQPVAPPIPNATSFYLRFFKSISGLRDNADRPLHEVDFREQLSNDDTKPCPYPGSRHGYLMNQSALRVIANDWRRIRAGLSLLTAEISLEPFGREAGTLMWARSLLPMFVPLYALHTVAHTGADITLPTDVSGLFKVMLDVPTTVDLMLVEQWSAAEPGDPEGYSPEAIAAYAERKGILNNGKWTCAGPPGLISELLVLLRPARADNDGDASSLDTLVSPEDFEAFATPTIRQYALSQAFQVCTTFVMERAFARVGNYRGYVHPPDDQLAAYERRRRIVIGRCQDEVTATRVICRFCDIATEGAADTVHSESRAAMLDAIVRSAHGSSADLLKVQIESEVAFQAAVIALQDEVGAVFSAPDPSPVDFSPLSGEDFPSAILRRCLASA